MLPSFVYSHVSLVFAIRPSPDFSESLKHFLGPFNLRLWSLLGGILVTGNVVILALKLLPSNVRRFVIGGHVNRTPILNMWNAFLGGVVVAWYGLDRRAPSTFAKTLFIIWSFGCLILRGSYQGSLYGFLRRDDVDTSLDTVKAISSSNCDIHSPMYALSQLRPFGIDPDSERTHPFYDSYQNALDRLRTGEISGAVYVDQFAVDYNNLINSRNDPLRTTEDRLILQSVSFYFRLYSEHGLIDHWSERYKSFIDDESIRNTPAPMVLSLQNIHGSLAVLVALLLISILIFILEVVSRRNASIRRFIDFFTY